MLDEGVFLTITRSLACVRRPANNALQVTFDPLPTFASAKAGIASNAPERRRWATGPQR